MTQKIKKPGTEQVDPRYKGIDTWDNQAVLHSILTAQVNAAKAIDTAIPSMAAAAEDAALRLSDPQKSGRIIYIGAGTPARIAMQDGTELPPTFGWSGLRLAFVIAGGEQALTRAVEGAEDDVIAAADQIAALHLTPHDVCLAISASGATPFTVAACRAARDCGALTIGISSNAATPLLQAAQHGILIETGAEPVAGSTRMNAGTAQSITLKMISTLIMIRLGHVYDGYMVDVQTTNDKLRKRAISMVCDIAGCQKNDAKSALAAADGHVKLAVLLTTGLSLEEGRDLLDKSGQNLRTALRSINAPSP